MGVAAESLAKAAAWQVQVTGMAGIVDVIVISSSKPVDTAFEEHKASEDVLTVDCQDAKLLEDGPTVVSRSQRLFLQKQDVVHCRRVSP
jgi:hypothetical protein